MINVGNDTKLYQVNRPSGIRLQSHFAIDCGFNSPLLSYFTCYP